PIPFATPPSSNVSTEDTRAPMPMVDPRPQHHYEPSTLLAEELAHLRAVNRARLKEVCPAHFVGLVVVLLGRDRVECNFLNPCLALLDHFLLDAFLPLVVLRLERESLPLHELALLRRQLLPGIQVHDHRRFHI